MFSLFADKNKILLKLCIIIIIIPTLCVQGSDPTAFEMIQKIQTLQKRLISKTEEVIEKDLLIQVR